MSTENLVSPEELAQKWLRQKFAPTAQQASVISAPPRGANLVVAGAGAGKTETMAARVVWLVANGFVLPEQVLGLTFTRKAASELGQRIRARLETLARSGFTEQLPADDPRHEALKNISPAVSTYDAYAGDIVNEYGLLVPVEPSGRIITDAEKWMITRDLVLDWSDDISTDKNVGSIIKHIHNLSDEMDNHLAPVEEAEAETRALIASLEDADNATKKGLTQKGQKLLDVQRLRLDLLPMVEAFRARLKELDVRSFGQQMSIAADIAQNHETVGASQRQRFRVVMLDEYQDTAHSQRILLRSLFGDGQDPDLSVTAVGDPMQSIYGFRGATASNLEKFMTDFPGPAGPAQKLELTTSWRNPSSVLQLANAVSDWTMEAGEKPRLVSPLTSRPGAEEGIAKIAFFDEYDQELEWLTEELTKQWESYIQRKQAAEAQGETISPFSAAVLVRKNAHALPVFESLKNQGVPVEMSGNTGLLDIPEVADVYATLRVLVDPQDDPALLRLLTGPRFNLGAKDLQVLAQRAEQLKRRAENAADLEDDEAAELPGNETDRWEHNPAYEDLRGFPETLREQLLEVVPDPSEPSVGLADAIADFADAEEFGMSAVGAQRISELSRELGYLRRNSLTKPLPDLIADIETMIGVRTEVMTRWHSDPEAAIGTSHLDEFAKVVRQFAEINSSSATALVDYLRAAYEEDAGLEPGEVQAKTNTVQILTVHRSKGLEWDIVAVPFATRSQYFDAQGGTTKTERWTQNADRIPSSLRGDAATETEEGYPIYDTLDAETSTHFTKAADEFKDALVAYEAREAERLFYVAITRTERVLLASASAWQKTTKKPLDPSVSLTLLNRKIAHTPTGVAGAEVVTWSDQGSIPSKADQKRIEKGKITPIDELIYPTEEQFIAREEYKDHRDANDEASEQAPWPQPAPLAQYPGATEGVELVSQAKHALADSAQELPEKTLSSLARQWQEETELLIQEFNRAKTTEISVPMSTSLTATQAVAMNQDPVQFARRRRRPIPMEPQPYAKRGTAFHNWVEQHYNQAMLFDEDEMPGASDATLQDPQLERLKQNFLQSEWADRTPESVEGAYLVNIGGYMFNGRMDAVFHEGGDLTSGWLIVDWKTGKKPVGRAMKNAELQLAAYRLAWSKILSRKLGRTVSPENVRTAFYYVRTNDTHLVQDLPSEDELVAWLGLAKDSGEP